MCQYILSINVQTSTIIFSFCCETKDLAVKFYKISKFPYKKLKNVVDFFAFELGFEMREIYIGKGIISSMSLL